MLKSSAIKETLEDIEDYNSFYDTKKEVKSVDKEEDSD